MPNMANRSDQNTMKSAFLAGPSVRAAMTRITYPDKPDRTEATPITAAPLGVIVRCTALGLLTCSERSGDRRGGSCTQGSRDLSRVRSWSSPVRPCLQVTRRVLRSWVLVSAALRTKAHAPRSQPDVPVWSQGARATGRKDSAHPSTLPHCRGLVVAESTVVVCE